MAIDRDDAADRERDRDDTELMFLGVEQQAEQVCAGKTTSRALVEAALRRIARADPGLGAFRIVLADQALAEADARDAQQPTGPLHGVPVAVKDELDVAGQVTTFGGAANRTPVSADSEAVRRLRAAGAVVIGKTAMPEFGQWPFTESAAYGRTLNPWDTTRTPGGSSGGSAAARGGGGGGPGRRAAPRGGCGPPPAPPPGGGAGRPP
ncbi:amidase family protein, partial [Streptomyces sp. NPDC059552]|uniref:amidase family protein n=1 Tax=Streptomyces sp. NPDC059552 TaxID=3346862 RepID=UPI00367DCB14